MTNGRLQDKVAVITGGNSGIGLASAEHFIAEGASVVMFGRQDSVHAEATRLGKRAVGIRLCSGTPHGCWFTRGARADGHARLVAESTRTGRGVRELVELAGLVAQAVAVPPTRHVDPAPAQPHLAVSWPAVP